MHAFSIAQTIVRCKQKKQIRPQTALKANPRAPSGTIESSWPGLPEHLPTGLPALES